MMNKDFLKQVLSGEKRLIELKHVKFINVPVYDELAIKNMYPLAKEEPNIMLYFSRQTAERTASRQRLFLEHFQHNQRRIRQQTH